MTPRMRRRARQVALAATLTVCVALIVVLAYSNRGRIRTVTTQLTSPLPTPTPAWIGRIQEIATPMSTYQSRVASVDPATGRQVTAGVSLREGPGRASEPTSFVIQPGERMFIVGTDVVGRERFFKVRSFDGMRRGWLAESTIAPGDRPASR